jgi:L-amino acid N-acyltransferase YncA
VVAYAYGGAHRSRAAYQWSVDVSVYVHRDHHRRGHGRTLYNVLLQLLVLQGYRRAHAGVALPNPGSVGLHESLGFVPVGVYPAVGFKDGRWLDVGWFTRPLLPAIDAPPAPRALTGADLRAADVAGDVASLSPDREL